jgi:hypothetical protein
MQDEFLFETYPNLGTGVGSIGQRYHPALEGTAADCLGKHVPDELLHKNALHKEKHLHFFQGFDLLFFSIRAVLESGSKFT